jgi:hypothetical protein
LISQRDIVEISFPLSQGNLKHPAIVLSSNEAIQMEAGFMAMMLTTSSLDDEFTFEIESDMMMKPLRSYCQARLHLVSFFHIDQVQKNAHYNNRMKQEYFEEVIKQLNLIVFKIHPSKFSF